MQMILNNTTTYISRKIGLILMLVCSYLTSFAQLPVGAKETFHLKIEQENRLSQYSHQGGNSYNSYKITGTNMSYGALIELSYRQVTLGASFLNDPQSSGESGKTDLEAGYEFTLTRNLKLQPFIGSEINETGTGFTTGIKLNRNIEIFDYISLVLFTGLRYSNIHSLQDSFYYDASDISEKNLSISLGVYAMIFDYKRPKIRRDW